MFALVLTATSLSGVHARRGDDGGDDATSSTSSSSTATPSSQSLTYSSSYTETSSHAPATSTSSAPSSSSSLPAILIFDAPSNATTCGDASFSWSTQGVPPTTPLTLQVMNGTRAMRVLGQNVPVTASRIDWHTVDVDQGVYTVTATDSGHTTNLFAQSAPFSVADGADRSCLDALSAPAESQTPDGVADATPPPPSSNGGAGTNQALVLAVCAISAALLLFALASCAYVFRRHYYRYRTRPRHRPGGPRYLF